MDVWIDTDSGTYGTSNIVFMKLSDDELEDFADLSDEERGQIADMYVQMVDVAVNAIALADVRAALDEVQNGND